MSFYLDNAGTTKPKKEVIDTMMPYFTDKWYNPSSLYGKATEVKKDIEQARKTVGEFINAKGNEIFFTSSGSESNNWAIQGFVNHSLRSGLFPTIITTTIEHKSILACVKNVNADVYYVDVDDKGFICLDMLEDILKFIDSEKYENKAILVSLQYANNEIGTIQPIKTLTALAHKYNAIVHTDATQIFGAMPIDVRELDVDLMSASGHKVNTPKGIGVLYKKDGIEIDPLIYGSQMDGLRGGSENVPYIMGFSKAVELCDVSHKKTKEFCDKRNFFIDLLKERFNCTLNGSYIHRLPNNINVTFPQNITGESLLYTLDISDIQISTGSACNAHSIEPSYVLKAIGLNNDKAMRTVRFTLSNDITCHEIDNVINEIDKAMKIIEM